MHIVRNPLCDKIFRYTLFVFVIIYNAFLSFSADAITIQNISAEGSCAIVGMSAEQCQMIALQRARASAIEQAAGIRVSSSTIVTNMALTAEFIKTYSKGFIVKEKAVWLPLDQYQKDASTPPIPEYSVKIVADISMPEPKIRPIGLNAKANSFIFKNGEKATIEIKAERIARIAIFNITADDKVAMLFPHEYEQKNIVTKDNRLIFPHPNAKIELVMHTLPNYKRDTKAFFVVAMDDASKEDFNKLFAPSVPMSITAFFQKYSRIADYCEDLIVAYEVINPEQ